MTSPTDELEDKVTEILSNLWVYPIGEERAITFDEAREQLLELVQQHDKWVIGVDEPTARGRTTRDIRLLEALERNQLRAEQRLRAGIGDKTL